MKLCKFRNLSKLFCKDIEFISCTGITLNFGRINLNLIVVEQIFIIIFAQYAPVKKFNKGTSSYFDSYCIEVILMISYPASFIRRNCTFTSFEALRNLSYLRPGYF